MATRAKKSLGAGAGDAPRIVNVININGSNYSLGDLRHADFSSLEDPKASVKSIQAWAISLNNILRDSAQQAEED